LVLLDYYIGMSEKQAIFTLLNGLVTMKRSSYNPTSDAVWLAAFVHDTNKIKTVLDVGIGTGGVSLCLLSRLPNLKVTGIDVSGDMLDICRVNAALNNKDITLLNKDILNWSTTDRFDLVVTNPPYFKGTPAKHNAHHNADIKEWIKKSSARVSSNGYFCTIVDTACADQVIACLNAKKFGDIQIFPLFGAKNTAERVLIRAKNGVKTGTTIYSGTSMNNDSILRDGLTIDGLLSTLGTK
jgi:tRNA1(Val) A37 N6-methylase TrmN6